MTWKAEVSDSAVQSTMLLREPIQTTEKWRWKEKFFLRFARRDHPYAPLYTVFGSGHTTPKYLAPALTTASHWPSWLVSCNSYGCLACLVCMSPLEASNQLKVGHCSCNCCHGWVRDLALGQSSVSCWRTTCLTALLAQLVTLICVLITCTQYCIVGNFVFCIFLVGFRSQKYKPWKFTCKY